MATPTPIALLDDQPVNSIVTVRATLSALQLMVGELWASLQLDDSGDVVTVLVFVQTFAAIPDGVLRPDSTLQFDARVLRDVDGITKLTPVTTPVRAKPSDIA